MARVSITPGTPPGAKLHRGVWLPETETHFVKMMDPTAKRYAELPDGRATYQRHKYLAALGFVADPRVFVDVGAHVGLWAYQAERDFDRVISFEPVEDFREIYPFNMRTTNWECFPCALGARDGSVALKVNATDTGCTHITGDGDVPLRTLDSFDLPRIDLMKIDVEGFERDVVEGARDTLVRTRPVMVVEQKGNDAKNFGADRDGAVDFLKAELGMVPLADPIAGDWIMGWPG